MTMETLSLSGIWTLTGQDENGKAISLPITIPGYVHPVLEQAGIIPPIYWRQNAQCCQWIEKVEWTFTKTFDVADCLDLSRAEIQFGGIDTYADVYLNDKHLASSKNMFVPLVCQVSEILRHGQNELKVVVHPYAEMIKDKDKDHSAAFEVDRVHVRRVQCTFWWDWVDRFISAGLWKDVELRFPPESTIDNVYVYTQAIDKTSASLILKLKTIKALQNNCRFVVDITDPDGKNVWHTAGRVYLDEISLQADLAEARLWWPNGYGEQPLYDISVRLLSADGEELDSRAFKTGIRTIRFEYLRDQPGSEEEKRTQAMRERTKETDYPQPGESCILLVNGERIFCKGGNFVPPNPFPGTIPESHYENLVRLAADGGMNCLRVWGGGEYEPDCFYSYCDKYGVLLSHDFMLSCGDYPEEDPEFVENFRQEVHAAVIALRNHCCLAFWSGNNENCDGHDWDDPNTNDMSLLPDVYLPELSAHDPARPFRPGSPWGGHNNGDNTIGDCHGSWWWRGAEKITPDYFSLVPRFSSENPCEGYPMPSVLKHFLAPEDLAQPDASEALEYHIKNNSFFTDHLGWPSVHGRLIINAKTLLGESSEAARTLFLRAYIQYEWSRFVIEGMRRAKWYSSAVQFWMYNDCWPALGYAMVDFYGRPKGGWYCGRRAYAPVAAAIAEEKGELVCYLLNDSLKTPVVDVRLLKFDTMTGKYSVEKSETVTLKANENTVLWRLQRPSDDSAHTLVFLEISENGRLIDRARWNEGWLANLEFGQAKVSYTRKGNTLSVTCQEGLAIGVTFDGDFVMDDNFIDLLPGETRTLTMCPPYGEKTVGDEITACAYNGQMLREN